MYQSKLQYTLIEQSDNLQYSFLKILSMLVKDFASIFKSIFMQYSVFCPETDMAV